MADVAVNVMVDGKGVWSAGAVGTPDPTASILEALQLAGAHFQRVRAQAVPPGNPTAKPQDNSL